MNVKLYRAWVRFVKTRIGPIGLSENNVIKDNKHKRTKFIVDFGVHKCYVWQNSKKYWLWAAYRCACKPKYILWFIFENWNKRLKFCNIFPEVSIYMDLKALTPNDIINKMTNEIATVKCWQSLDDDILKITEIISNAINRYVESKKCLNQQKTII